MDNAEHGAGGGVRDEFLLTRDGHALGPEGRADVARALDGLRGRVVLVEFWTFGCYNCQNVEPYVKSWHDKFKNRGLVVIGVHSPEFGHERVLKNVRSYIHEHNIQYAVAIDNEYKIWNSFQNHYWPAVYLIDKKGVIRHIRIGEGGYDETERAIVQLLAEQ